MVLVIVHECWTLNVGFNSSSGCFLSLSDKFELSDKST